MESTDRLGKHFGREIDRLKEQIFELCTDVEEAVQNAAKALKKRDAEFAKTVIAKDDQIDAEEVHVEEECLKILALHQPVAQDLRFVVAILKINNDLERIGDLAVNVAERAIFLADQKETPYPMDFITMAKKARAMLRSSIDALVNEDYEGAQAVCAADDEVDAMNREMYQIVEKAILDDPAQVKPLLHMLSASRHIERIADLATNIAEDVIYMIHGDIVRHKNEDYGQQEAEEAQRN